MTDLIKQRKTAFAALRLLGVPEAYARPVLTNVTTDIDELKKYIALRWLINGDSIPPLQIMTNLNIRQSWLAGIKSNN